MTDYSEFDDLLGDEPAEDDDEFIDDNIDDNVFCDICHNEVFIEYDAYFTCNLCEILWCEACNETLPHPGVVPIGDNDACCYDCFIDNNIGDELEWKKRISDYTIPESVEDYSEFDDILGDEPAEDNDEFTGDEMILADTVLGYLQHNGVYVTPKIMPEHSWLSFEELAQKTAGGVLFNANGKCVDNEVFDLIPHGNQYSGGSESEFNIMISDSLCISKSPNGDWHIQDQF